MRHAKHRKSTALRSWIDKVRETVGKDIDEAAFDRLTLRELNAVLSLVAGSYGTGAENTRQWNRRYKADQIKWKQERLSKLGRDHLKVVAGGL